MAKVQLPDSVPIVYMRTNAQGEVDWTAVYQTPFEVTPMLQALQEEARAKRCIVVLMVGLEERPGGDDLLLEETEDLSNGQ